MRTWPDWSGLQREAAPYTSPTLRANRHGARQRRGRRMTAEPLRAYRAAAGSHWDVTECRQQHGAGLRSYLGTRQRRSNLSIIWRTGCGGIRHAAAIVRLPVTGLDIAGYPPGFPAATEGPDPLPALLAQLTLEQSTAARMGRAYLAVAEHDRLATTEARLGRACDEGVPGSGRRSRPWRARISPAATPFWSRAGCWRGPRPRPWR